MSRAPVIRGVLPLVEQPPRQLPWQTAALIIAGLAAGAWVLVAALAFAIGWIAAAFHGAAMSSANKICIAVLIVGFIVAMAVP